MATFYRPLAYQISESVFFLTFLIQINQNKGLYYLLNTYLNI